MVGDLRVLVVIAHEKRTFIAYIASYGGCQRYKMIPFLALVASRLCSPATVERDNLPSLCFSCATPLARAA
jgi:hypothetical protein